MYAIIYVCCINLSFVAFVIYYSCASAIQLVNSDAYNSFFPAAGAMYTLRFFPQLSYTLLKLENC